MDDSIDLDLIEIDELDILDCISDAAKETVKEQPKPPVASPMKTQVIVQPKFVPNHSSEMWTDRYKPNTMDDLIGNK